MFSIRINTSRSVDMQTQPLLFTYEKSISSLSDNTNCSNCISIVCKRTQSEILQFPFGNLAIQILRDRSWRWTFATSFPGHCACKASKVPQFSRATLFNGRDSVMTPEDHAELRVPVFQNQGSFPHALTLKRSRWPIFFFLHFWHK